MSLPLAGACSDDEGAPAPPVDLTLTITALDGSAPESEGTLRCDGTVAVQVSIEPGSSFTLRPLHACGASARCGYVHVEAFDGSGSSLGSVSSVTTLGLLELPPEALPELARVDAVLLRGIDAEPVLNADGSEVRTSVDVSRAAPTECEPTGAGGAGGAPGSGGAPSNGGAPGQLGGASPGGAPAAAGAAPDSGGAPPGGAGGIGSNDPAAGAGGA